MGKDSDRLYFSAVKLFDSLQLAGFEAGQIAINLFDKRLLKKQALDVGLWALGKN